MTRWNALTAVAVLVLPAAAMAGDKKVPPQLTQARYVALGYDTGDRFVDARSVIGHPDAVTQEDSDALDALRDLVSDWDRFVLTERVDQADIVIAVRTSRRAAFEVGSRIGHDDPDGRAARAQSPTFDAEVSSPGDILSVYAASGGRPGTLLWRERRSGDDFPRASFERFKADVTKHATK